MLHWIKQQYHKLKTNTTIPAASNGVCVVQRLDQERDALISIALELSRSIDKTLGTGWLAGLKCKIELNKKPKHATSTLEYVETLNRLDTTLRLGDAKAIIEHVNSAINAFEIADVNSWGDIATEPRRESIKACVLKPLNQIHNKM